MIPILPLIGIMCAAIGLGTLGFIAVVGHQPNVTADNLRRGIQPRKKRRSLSGRQPKYAATLTKITPKRELAMINQLIAKAGRPPTWPLERIIVAKAALTVAALLIVAFGLPRAKTPFLMIATIALAVMLHFIPELLLHNSGTKRRTAMTNELADVLDQVSIAVSAGLSFDAAMLRVASHSSGVLGQELMRTLQDIQVGQSREDAYAKLADRAGVPDLSRFLRSLVQAEQFGLSMASVLETHAKEMRLKRKQLAEEKAMKIPVNTLFPLIFCIMPVLFIVIMGPAAIQIMNTLGK